MIYPNCQSDNVSRQVKSVNGYLFVLASIVFICTFVLAACAGGTAVPLGIPENLRIEGTTLRWDEVANALGYEVSVYGINLEFFPSSGNSFSLSSLAEDKTYSISVRALGDGENFASSPFSSMIPYSTKKNYVSVIAPVYNGETLTYGDDLPEITTATTGGTVSLDAGQVLQGGTREYTWTFTPDDTSFTVWSNTTGKISLTVQKAYPTVSENPVSSNLTYGDTLSKSMLAGGAASVGGSFVWANKYTVPTVTNSGYEAVFMPNDSTNYSEVSVGIVAITVSKADYKGISHTAISTTYTATNVLSDLEGLNENFSWAEPTTKLEVSVNRYSAIYNKDPDNYNDFIYDVLVNVAKATPIITENPAATGLTYTALLSESTLIGGTADVAGSFSWTERETVPTVLNGGYKVTFTPTDGANYKEVIISGIAIIVAKAIPTVNTVPTASGITYGAKLSASNLLNGTANVSGYFSWADANAVPPVVNNGYEAVFYPLNVNYETVSVGTVAVSVAKANYSGKSHSGFSTVYTATNTLADLPDLSDGYSWVAPDTKLLVAVRSYAAIYNGDSANYNDFHLNITVTVDKATPIITSNPTAAALTYGATLSESALNGGLADVVGAFSWIEQAMVPIVLNSGYDATFIPTDNVNYSSVTIHIAISVAKANQTIPIEIILTAALVDVVTKVSLANLGSVYEYSLDNLTWQESNIFESLTPDTQYTFYARLKANDNYLASAAISVSRTLTPIETDIFTYLNNAITGLTTLGKTFSSLTIPKNIQETQITAINSAAFTNCTQLLDVVIPDSVTSVAATAFTGCTNLSVKWYYNPAMTASNFRLYLTEVIVPIGVTAIAEYAFSNCPKLAEVTLSEGVESIGNYALSACNSTRITISSTVTSIGYSAFYNSANLYIIWHYNYLLTASNFNNYLYEVIIQKTTASIANSAFAGCTKLTDINLQNVTSIGSSAFSGCTGLTNIQLPSQLKTIGASAFYGCTGITQTKLVVSDTVTSIGRNAFYGWSSLKSIEIPFVGTSRTATGNDAKFGVIFSTSSYTGSVRVSQYYTDYYIPSQLDTVVVTNTDSIPDYAFHQCTVLKNIELPANLTSIGISAFVYCYQLTSIEIPDTVASIGNEAFSRCYGLMEVELPSGITKISDGLFSGCSGLSSLVFPSTVTSIGASAFNNTALTQFTIPTGITRIEEETFLSCSKLEVISIPDSIKYIGASAFAGCSKLDVIDIPYGVTFVGTSAFAGCAVRSLVIPDTVTQLGMQVFFNCDSLESLTVPFIGTGEAGENEEYSFLSLFREIASGYSGGNVTRAVVNGNTTTYRTFRVSPVLTTLIVTGGGRIGNKALMNVSTLRTVSLSNITSIGSEAFSGCTLTDISFPEMLREIGEKAFNITTVTNTSLVLPDLETVGNGAFSGWTSVTHITLGAAFVGDIFQLPIVNVNPRNIVIPIENSVYYKYDGMVFGNPKTKCLLFPKDTEGAFVMPEWTTDIGTALQDSSLLTSLTLPASIETYVMHALSGLNSLVSLTLPIRDFYQYEYYRAWELNFLTSALPALRSVTINGGDEVPERAFKDQLYLTEINLPALTILKIGKEAFMNCRLISNITFSSALQEIGDSAFYGCGGLLIESIVFPDSLKRVGIDAFYANTSLKRIEFGSGLEYVSGFMSCINLEEVILKEGVTTIGKHAFNGCSNLTSVNFPESLITISQQAFYLCRNLTSVVLGSNVNTIGNSAFNFAGIREIIIPASVQNIGSAAFPESTYLWKFKIYCEAASPSPGWYGGTPGYVFEHLTYSHTVRIAGGPSYDVYYGIRSEKLPTVAWHGSYEYDPIIVFNYGREDEYTDDLEMISVFVPTEWTDEEGVVYMYSEEEPTEEGNFWYFDENLLPAKWETV